MTDNADLLFSQSPATSGELVFGDTSAGDTNASAVLAGSFAKLQGSVRVARLRLVNVAGSFRPLQVTTSVRYSSDTARPTVAATRAPHQIAAKLQQGPQHRQHDTARAPAGWDVFWQRATGVSSSVQTPIVNTQRTAEWSRQAKHQDAAPVRSSGAFAHQDADRAMRRMLAAVYQDCTPARLPTLFRHQDTDHTKRASRSAAWSEASRSGKPLTAPYNRGRSLDAWRQAKHQEARRPPAGISTSVTPGGRQPCYTPNPALVFSFPYVGSPALVFQCGDYTPEQPGGTVVVPIQRVYIVLNSVSLTRVSDGAHIPTKSLNLSLDASSWAWSFDASVPMQAQALIEPDGDNVEVLASVNGTTFRLIVESISRERTFGQASLRISGRGRNALLDSPYAPTMTFGSATAMTANQLAEAALTYNGVPIGWSLDWQLEDWLVPGGVFSHQGSHITALNAIAQAAGGYVQPHHTDTSVRILPKYPVAPWAWGDVTADFVLPADVTTRESISWANKTPYNQVFVSGQQAGATYQVRRAGTAGEIEAPMVTDALITATAAGRQRGMSILADTGRIATVGLGLPVLAETGIIIPGKFVRYVDGSVDRLGIVRGTNVSVGASAVDTRQTISLEVHE